MIRLISTGSLAALLLAGCTTSATENSASLSNSTTTTAVASETTTTTANADTPAEPAAGAQTTGSYRVVDEAQPGMPAEAAAALQKAKVPPPPQSMATPDSARLRLDTTKGAITIQLDGKAAPLHVKSFVYLAGRGFYNNTVWHRYEPGFVIQGGDPLTKNPKLEQFFGMGGPGYQVPREFNSLKHEKYVVSMARSDDPDSAGSQFYITLDPAPFLDDGYTVFGKVISGQNVVSTLRKGDKLKSVTWLDKPAKKQ